jgi:hypothetical protein
MSAFDPELAVDLEVAIYADDFRGDFDTLLRLRGAHLVLRWDGTRNSSLATLCVQFDDAPRPEPIAQYKLGYQRAVWVLTSPRATDFRERFQAVLKLHHAELLLGISPVKQVARMSVGYPHAPRMDPFDPMLSLRLIATRRNARSEYRPGPKPAAPAEAAA